VLSACFLFTACEKSPITVALHEPIYPASGEDVAYTVERVTSGTINSANLYEIVSSVSSTGAVTPGTEVLLRSWTSPSGDLTFTKSGGYSANSLVTYRVEAVLPEGSPKEYRITYAIRPYPVPNMPAPVYAQGDVDDVMDVVFIPDTDITNMGNFRIHCRRMIRDSLFDEDNVRFWRKQFNVYINPLRGTATDYDRIAIDGVHQTPANWANLSFAEGKALLHQNNLRDYATGGLFSSEMQNRGTMLHEGGHALFGLADEYAGGAHWQAAELPNNWSGLATAQADAPGRHKTAADAVQMGTTGWYKICASACQMNGTGLTHVSYDEPCVDRIHWAFIDNAIN
jgi:hypothetical protein